LQRAGADRGAAGVAAGAGQDRRAGADLVDRAGSGDDAVEGRRIGAVEGERGVVGSAFISTRRGLALRQ
jgi:hypothetical protein